MVKNGDVNSLILKTFNYRLQEASLEPHLMWHCTRRILGHMRSIMVCFRELLICTGEELCFIDCIYKS